MTISVTIRRINTRQNTEQQYYACQRQILLPNSFLVLHRKSQKWLCKIIFCCFQSQFGIRKSWKPYLKPGDSTTKPMFSREVMCIIKECHPVFSEDSRCNFQVHLWTFLKSDGEWVGRRRRRRMKRKMKRRRRKGHCMNDLFSITACCTLFCVVHRTPFTPLLSLSYLQVKQFSSHLKEGRRRDVRRSNDQMRVRGMGSKIVS